MYWENNKKYQAISIVGIKELCFCYGLCIINKLYAFGSWVYASYMHLLELKAQNNKSVRVRHCKYKTYENCSPES